MLTSLIKNKKNINEIIIKICKRVIKIQGFMNDDKML